ncbi:MAG: hypothetical protein GY789_28440 [Hyphomicrobiales bacterium]|nr:hypothetical protein [Hyphomicrobiales bacterium]
MSFGAELGRCRGLLHTLIREYTTAIATLFTVHSADSAIEATKPVIAFAGEIGAHLDIVVVGIMKTMPAAFYGGVPECYLTDVHDQTIRVTKDRCERRSNTRPR